MDDWPPQQEPARASRVVTLQNTAPGKRVQFDQEPLNALDLLRKAEMALWQSVFGDIKEAPAGRHKGAAE